MNPGLGDRPGMVRDDRPTITHVMLLMLVGVLIWVGLMHISRDAYRWAMGESLTERCE